MLVHNFAQGQSNTKIKGDTNHNNFHDSDHASTQVLKSEDVPMPVCGEAEASATSGKKKKEKKARPRIDLGDVPWPGDIPPRAEVPCKHFVHGRRFFGQLCRFRHVLKEEASDIHERGRGPPAQPLTDTEVVT